MTGPTGTARMNIAGMDDGTLQTLRSYFIASAECATNEETRTEAAAFLGAVTAEMESREAAAKAAMTADYLSRTTVSGDPEEAYDQGLADGAAAERDRIRQLAHEKAAEEHYAIASSALTDFADLLGGDQP